IHVSCAGARAVLLQVSCAKSGRSLDKRAWALTLFRLGRMMRGAIAAACAAVILGLASPGAFACASVAAARGAAEQQHPALALRSSPRAVVTHVTPRDAVR